MRALNDWLVELERRHPRAIDLGLERVSRVRDAAGLRCNFPILTVGGTNGKGSTCAMLEAMLLRAGYRVGLYTSPHLIRYNERVRIEGRQASDAALVAAFERIESARAEVPLTYFEFGTLAAVELFIRSRVEIAVLEVGLGGRLDAVNAFDADCAVVTGVDIDHTEYLGATRETIGFEKAGIFRSGRPAVCGDQDPPRALLGHAEAIGAELLLIGRDFGFLAGATDWKYWSAHGKRSRLPYPALRGRYQLGNAACAIAALESLHDRLAVDMGAIRRALVEVELPGRFQVLPGRPTVILDVGHNPQAARALRGNLEAMPRAGRTLAVFGMLADKDIAGVAGALAEVIDEWFVCSLPGPRGAAASSLASVIGSLRPDAGVSEHSDPAQAFAHARETARGDDRILVFGSFYTVSGVLQSMRRDDRSRENGADD
ncbi:MAG TPA: bifunctional tetrahydrofolate synthase/dihydrofolate synthase [Burkholderiales bacterium]|nr:bifunctional tetrahydrofolate synthase/dihydrofolate synthase [Burkholderiales bacterium]